MLAADGPPVKCIHRSVSACPILRCAHDRICSRQDLEWLTIKGSEAAEVSPIQGADRVSAVAIRQQHQGCLGDPNVLICIAFDQPGAGQKVGGLQRREFIRD